MLFLLTITLPQQVVPCTSPKTLRTLYSLKHATINIKIKRNLKTIQPLSVRIAPLSSARWLRPFTERNPPWCSLTSLLLLLLRCEITLGMCWMIPPSKSLPILDKIHFLTRNCLMTLRNRALTDDIYSLARSSLLKMCLHQHNTVSASKRTKTNCYPFL